MRKGGCLRSQYRQKSDWLIGKSNLNSIEKFLELLIGNDVMRNIDKSEIEEILDKLLNRNLVVVLDCLFQRFLKLVKTFQLKLERRIYFEPFIKNLTLENYDLLD